MEYLYLPKDIENNRSEEVRVVDGHEVNDEHKFVVQTRIVVGGIAKIKPDWVTVADFEELKSAIAYTLKFFPPFPIEKPLTTEQVKQQIKQNNGLIKTIITCDFNMFNVCETLNDIVDDRVLDEELTEEFVSFGSSYGVNYTVVGHIPGTETLLIEVVADINDDCGFLED